TQAALSHVAKEDYARLDSPLGHRDRDRAIGFPCTGRDGFIDEEAVGKPLAMFIRPFHAHRERHVPTNEYGAVGTDGEYVTRGHGYLSELREGGNVHRLSANEPKHVLCRCRIGHGEIISISAHDKDMLFAFKDFPFLQSSFESAIL